MLSLIIDQVDIVGTYFKSLLTNNDLFIFMKLLPGIKTFKFIKGDLVTRLLQNIYGLRQSGRPQNERVVTFFTSLGLKILNADPSILISQQGEDIVIINVYIDNFLLTSKHRILLDQIKSELKWDYNIKDLGEIKMIIG